MKTSELNGTHLGLRVEVPIRNAPPHEGVLHTVRHLPAGTYVTFENDQAMWFTDSNREVRFL